MCKFSRWSIGSSLGIAALLLAGCATKPKETATETKKTDEYTTVTSMGSWIPRKVKTKADVIGDSTGVTDKKILERAVNAGNTRVARDPAQSR